MSTLVASVTVTLIFFFLFTALGAIGSLIQSLIALVDILVGLICNTRRRDGGGERHGIQVGVRRDHRSAR